MSNDVDTLIVGHGLAGAILAWFLKEKGQRVTIIDDSFNKSASVIAAGIVNPLTGKRFVVSKNVDTILPFSVNFYQSCENKFDQQFFFPIPMLRLFNTEQEKQLLHKRVSQPGYEKYIGKKISPRHIEPKIVGSWEGFLQNNTGYLDIRSFLQNIKNHFETVNQLIESKLNYAEIAIQRNCVYWKQIRAKRIIFCEGSGAQKNPWFDWLPFQFAYGSILTVRANESLPKYIINNGKWVLPLDHNTLRIGSTFHWQPLNHQARDADKQQLINGLFSMLKLNDGYNITNQQDGVRPSTLDKSPFIGMHQNQPCIGIFNGFGAKGVMTIPYYAELFSNHLLYGDELPAPVSINRIAVH